MEDDLSAIDYRRILVTADLSKDELIDRILHMRKRYFLAAESSRLYKEAAEGFKQTAEIFIKNLMEEKHDQDPLFSDGGEASEGGTGTPAEQDE